MSAGAASGGRRGLRAAAVAVATVAFGLGLAARVLVPVWLGAGLAAALGLALAFGVDGARLRALLRPRRSDVLLGVAAGLAAAAASHALHPLAAERLPFVEAEVDALYATLRAPPGPALALPLLLAIILAEECLWRGLLVDLLRGRRGLATTVVGSAAIYALPQIGSGSPVLVAVGLALGTGLAALRLATGGLVAPVLAHAAWGVVVFVLVPLD